MRPLTAIARWTGNGWASWFISTCSTGPGSTSTSSTPYLILDGELETALKFAAERGVDVHLILPGKPDKRIPYALAKTHYAALIRSGVKISEWVPGFVHAKVFVVG
ncbi:MAG: phospholipase D-like domain-containing protein [Faecalibacterium sp.]